MVPLVQPVIGADEMRRLVATSPDGVTSVCDLVGSSEPLAWTCADGEDPGGIASALFDLGGCLVGSCRYIQTAEPEAFAYAVGGPRSATNTIVAILEDNDGAPTTIADLGEFVVGYERSVTGRQLDESGIAELLMLWGPLFEQSVRLLWDELQFERSDGYQLPSNQLGL
jgi:hypothetical protein